MLPDRAVGVVVEVRYGPKLSVHPRRAFSLLLSMHDCPGLFAEVTYRGSCKVHCVSVRRHCCSDRQGIAVVNTLADSGAQVHRLRAGS